MAKDISIKYTDKNFNSLRSQLVDLSKNYFPDSYNDFSPTSPGMMFMEMAAYVGDILSFYQDSQVQETYLQYAKDPSNLYTLSYMMGYRPKVTTGATVELEVTHNVEAGSAPDYEPRFDQALKISAKAQISNGSQIFTTDDAVDFSFSSSLDPTEVSIFSVSGDNPSVYQLKKKVKARAGEIKSINRNVGSTPTKYTTITIEDDDIIGIVDVNDGSSFWTEVPFLGQSTVFTTATNTNASTKGKVPNFLSSTVVNKRFVTRFNSAGQLILQFGPGTSQNANSNFLPDASLVGFNNNNSNRRLDYAYDPSNFLFSDSYGEAPTGNLTIRYLKGGGIKSNVEANTLTNKFSVPISNAPTFTNGSNVSDTLAFTNPLAATGGKDGDTIEELRQNSLKAFAEQGRVVSKQDFAFRALTLPPNLGSVSKVFVTGQDDLINADKSENNPLGICMYVLSSNIDGTLALASKELKQNIKEYLSEFMLITDSLTVKDAYIVNIGIKFQIVSLPNTNSRDVLLDCTTELQTYFDTSKRAINQPINLSAIYTLLDRVKGVQTVQSVEVYNKNSTDYGAGYNEYGYDIKGATKENIIYPSYDPMIFEVKYPNVDIEGRITRF